MLRKINILLSLAGISMLALAFFACKGEHPGFKKTKSGLYYKVHEHTPGSRKVVVGDVVNLHLHYRTPSDSVFSDTHPQGPIMIDINESVYPGDIYEGLLLLHEGDSATFVLMSDSFFTVTAQTIRPHFLDSAGFFYLDVKILSVRSEDEYEADVYAENEERRKLELQEMIAFLDDNAITSEPSSTGMVYVEKKAGKGKMPAIGEILKLHYSVRLITGREIFDSRAENAPMLHQLGSGRSGKGFDEGLEKMKVGGEAMFIVPSHLAFGAEGGGAIPPFATLIFEVELLEAHTEEDFHKQEMKETTEKEEQEKRDLRTYLNANKLKVLPNESGLIYIELISGNGPKPQQGDKVKVHYDGKLLNGQRFDSSYDRGTPFEFILGQGQVIPGWDEGIALMNVGTKAQLIIPSRLGYGAQGSGNRIPPYSTLVFEVELLGVDK